MKCTLVCGNCKTAFNTPRPHTDSDTIRFNKHQEQQKYNVCLEKKKKEKKKHNSVAQQQCKIVNILFLIPSYNKMYYRQSVQFAVSQNSVQRQN